MLSKKFSVALINDEISSVLSETIHFLKSHNIEFVELRMIHNKNLLDYSLDEVGKFSDLLSANNINVSALASPLFKWYPDLIKKEYSNVDTFNFSPYLN